MKSSYEILSSGFIKFIGFFLSLYLCILCVKLFILNPRDAYWQENAFFVWLIIISAFILCIGFALSNLMKLNNSRIYLFGIFLLCIVKCVLFLFVVYTYASTLLNIALMRQIILCFGFLFLLLIFLHEQTSNNSLSGKSLLPGIIGITCCFIPILLTADAMSTFNNLFPRGYYFKNWGWVYYLVYATCVFILFFLGEELKSSLGFQVLILFFSFLFSVFVIDELHGGYAPAIFNYIMFLELLAVFCCIQVILKTFGIKEFISDVKKLLQGIVLFTCSYFSVVFLLSLIIPLNEMPRTSMVLKMYIALSCFFLIPFMKKSLHKLVLYISSKHLSEDSVCQINTLHLNILTTMKGLFILTVGFVYLIAFTTILINIWWRF